MRTEIELNRIAYEINGSGITVHTRVGPGCFESAYVPCFACELRRRKLEFAMKVPLTLRYDEVVVEGAHQADFIVEGSVIVEIKALERLARVHSRQLQTYMRLTGCPLGLILNFGAARLADGIKRQVNNFPFGTPPYGPDVPVRDPLAPRSGNRGCPSR
jgi:GxxExxY protein